MELITVIKNYELEDNESSSLRLDTCRYSNSSTRPPFISGGVYIGRFQQRSLLTRLGIKQGKPNCKWKETEFILILKDDSSLLN